MQNLNEINLSTQFKHSHQDLDVHLKKKKKKVMVNIFSETDLIAIRKNSIVIFR